MIGGKFEGSNTSRAAGFGTGIHVKAVAHAYKSGMADSVVAAAK